MISLKLLGDNTRTLEDTTIEDVLKTFGGLYQREDFQGALDALKSHETALPSGLWHYNMGLVKARLDRLPEARYHLLMAQKQEFRPGETATNLAVVEGKLAAVKLEQPLELWDHVVRSALWAQQGFFTFLGLVVLLAALWDLRQRRRFQRGILYAGLIAVPLLLNAWVGSWQKSVVTEQREVREGPSVIFRARTELPPGVLVVTRKKEDWREVLYPSRFAGWINDKGLLDLE